MHLNMYYVIFGFICFNLKLVKSINLNAFNAGEHFAAQYNRKVCVNWLEAYCDGFCVRHNADIISLDLTNQSSGGRAGGRESSWTPCTYQSWRLWTQAYLLLNFGYVSQVLEPSQLPFTPLTRAEIWPVKCNKRKKGWLKNSGPSGNPPSFIGIRIFRRVYWWYHQELCPWKDRIVTILEELSLEALNQQ